MPKILTGPERAHLTPTPDAYRQAQAAHLRQMARRGQPAVTPWAWLGAAPVAYVSDSRWVCDCPNCNNGPSVDVVHGFAACFECGAVFTHVTVPTAADARALEDIMSVRPWRNRHWRPGQESLADLERENRDHGLPDVAEIRRRQRGQE